MRPYSIKLRKYVKRHGFLSIPRNQSGKYGKKLDTATNAGPDALKTTFRKLVHKAAEATREITGNKIAHEIVNPKPVPTESSRNIEEIAILPNKRREILNELRLVLQNGTS